MISELPIPRWVCLQNLTSYARKQDHMQHYMRIAFISDSHGTTERVFNHLYNLQPNIILHAGDICSYTDIDDLQYIADVRAVIGNNDSLDMCNNVIAFQQLFQLKPFANMCGIEHILSKCFIRSLASTETLGSTKQLKLLVHGHTHVAKISYDDEQDIMFINPGSVTRGRGLHGKSFAFVDIPYKHNEINITKNVNNLDNSDKYFVFNDIYHNFVFVELDAFI